MTCWSAIACGCSRSLTSWTTWRRRAVDGGAPLDLLPLEDQVDRWGLEALNVRERRKPRMPMRSARSWSSGSSRSRWHTRVRSGGSAPSSLGRSGVGSGSQSMASGGYWSCRAQYRGRRLALVAGTAIPTSASLHHRRGAAIDATDPGEIVQTDCFFIGRLSGSKGAVWQYTAIDVASATPGRSCTPASATLAHATARR